MTPFSPTSSWMARRRSSTCPHAATSSPAPERTSGRSSSCCRRLPCRPAGGPRCPTSRCPPQNTWRRCLTCWTMTATPLRPSSSPSSSRTACGAAASPPPPSWSRWCPRGWRRSGPAATPRQPTTRTAAPTEQLVSRWSALRWAQGTCRTSTLQWRTASTRPWCFHTARWARRAAMKRRWRWRQSCVWTHRHSAAVTVNQVGFYFERLCCYYVPGLLFIVVSVRSTPPTSHSNVSFLIMFETIQCRKT